MSSVIRRALTTPILKLLSGRIARPSENWKQKIRTSNLPAEIQTALTTLIRKSRLWKSEKADISEELISHFRDALTLGRTPAQSLEEFGDLTNAAKLIRRAKIRSRPMSWHIYRNAVRGVVVMVAVYGGLFVYFLVGSPTVRVDYLERYNAAAVATPQAERAWTYYKPLAGEIERQFEAMLTRIDPQMPMLKRLELAIEIQQAEPGDTHWHTLVEHVQAMAPVLEKARMAAAMLQLGYVADRYMETPYEREQREQNGKDNDLMNGPFINTLIPHVQDMVNIADLLAQDARVALDEKDAARCTADLQALLNMSQQLGTSDDFVVTQVAGTRIATLGMDGIEQALRQRPELLKTEQLITLAHKLARPATIKVNLASERMVMLDTIQRMYTDDGRGGGRLTPGMVFWIGYISSVAGPIKGLPSEQKLTVQMISPGVATLASRKRTTEEAMRLYDMIELELAKPTRLHNFDAYESRLKEITATPLSRLEYTPIPLLMSSVQPISKTLGQCRAKAQALQTVIALELFKRKAGKYPETLAELVPDYLPALPQDPMTGDGLKYKLQEGRPLLYSVGTDLKDDGGTPPVDKQGHTENRRAAEFYNRTSKQTPASGDWVLFPTPTPYAP